MSEEEYQKFKNLDITNQLWKIYELLSDRSKLVVTQEIGTVEKQFTEQDMTECLVRSITPKSFFIFKNDLQMFLAFSNIKRIYTETKENGEFDLDVIEVKENYIYNFELKDDRKWVSKKWEKFKAVKNR